MARRVSAGGGVLQLLVIASAAAYVAAFAVTGALRAVYPYTIDGVEPGSLQEVRRVLAGQPLYVAPELGYVPLIYGPVFFYLAAAIAAVSGSALFGMRAVSLLASLGSIGLVTLLVRRETGSLAIGLVGGGLLAACSPIVDRTMDVGRMDALSLVLLLGSIAVARRLVFDPASGWRSTACCGLLMGLAILTKQTGLVVALVVGALLALSRPRQLMVYMVAVAFVVGGGMLLLTLQSGFWPLFYVWQLPRGHEIRLEYLPRFWSDLVTHFAIPVVFGPFCLYMRAVSGDRKGFTFLTAIGVGLIGMAWLSASSLGGGRNVELPGYAGFAIWFAVSLHDVLRLLANASDRTRAIRNYALFITMAQFGIMLYNPRLVVPYRSDMWDGDRLTATLSALPGPIFAGSFQGYVTDPAAAAPDLGAITELSGVFGGGGTPEGTPNWEGEFAGALVARHFTYVIVDPDVAAAIVTDLTTDFGYKDAGPLFPPGDVYWNWRTGWAPKAEVYVRP